MGREEDENQRLLREAVRFQKEGLSMSAAHVEVLKEHGVYLKQNSKFYEDQVKMAERYLTALDKRKTLESNLGKQIAANNQMQEAQVTLLRTQIREADEFMNSYKALADQEREKIKNAKEERKEIERILALKNKIRLNSKETAELAGLTSKFDTTDKEELLKIKDASEARRKTAASVVTELKRQNKEYKKSHEDSVNTLEVQQQMNKATSDIQSNTAGMLKTFLGVTDQSSTFLGSILQANEALAAGAEGKTPMTMMHQSMEGLLTPMNVVLSTMSKIFESTVLWFKAFDTATADFRKQTGIIETGLFGVESRVNNMQKANLHLGVSVEEAFAAQTDLNNSMASFNLLTESAQYQLLEITAVMGELGVNTQDTAQAFNVLNKGLGYTPAQLKETSLELLALSRNLKVPPELIMKDFNQASQELIKYGDRMFGVFKGLAEISKETGLEMNSLLSIAAKFDTFEEAGNTVGRLNAILGGPYLNALQMVYMTEDQRLKAMRDSIKMSGKVFGDLGRHEQQAIATAAGISSMSEANMLFNSTDAEFTARGMEMEEMRLRAQKAQATQEKFNQVMQSFAIQLQPVVTLLALVADAILFFVNPLRVVAEAIEGPDGKGGLVNAFGILTIAGYALAAMHMKGLIPSFQMTGFAAGLMWAQILGGLTLAVAGFAIFSGFLLALPKQARQLIGALLGIAGAFAAIYFWKTAAIAGPVLALAGAAVATAGIMAATGNLEGLASKIKGYKDGTPSAAPGVAAIAEDGNPEVVANRKGAVAIASSPALMNMEGGEAVHKNADLRSALGAPSINPAAIEDAVTRGIAKGLNGAGGQGGGGGEMSGGTRTPVQLVVNEQVLGEIMLPGLLDGVNQSMDISKVT